MLYDRLNQMMLRWRFRVLVGLPYVYDRLSVYPLDLNASLNASMSHEMSDIHLLMESGRFLMIEGGWLDVHYPVVGLRVMSRKLVTFRLQLMVFFKRKSLNIFVMSFRVRSAMIPDVLLITVSPSSR